MEFFKNGGISKQINFSEGQANGLFKEYYESGNINVIDDPTTDQRTFTYITTVGLYDSANNLLAVAKLSRPIEKNDEKDLTLRVRLDF